MNYDSVEIGLVVASYPQGMSVDVLLDRDGSRLSNVQVSVSTGSADTGFVDLPDIGGAQDDSRWNITGDRARYMRALVAFYRGIPVVIGFLLPQVNQVSFAEKNRRIMRHASDVYSSIDAAGNFEAYHPSGTYLRIGSSPAHEDLTGKDFDKKWAIKNNTASAPHVQLTVKNAGVEKASLNIDPAGNVTVTHSGNLSVATSGNTTIHSDGTMDISSGGNMSLSAPRIDLNQ